MIKSNEAIVELLSKDLLLKDRMLLVLYLYKEQEGFCRLSETVDGNSNWRNVAHQLFTEGYIEYPGKEVYSFTGRITNKGIVYIENKY